MIKSDHVQFDCFLKKHMLKYGNKEIEKLKGNPIIEMALIIIEF